MPCKAKNTQVKNTNFDYGWGRTGTRDEKASEAGWLTGGQLRSRKAKRSDKNQEKNDEMCRFHHGHCLGDVPSSPVLADVAGAGQTPKSTVLTMLWWSVCSWGGSRQVLSLAGDRQTQTEGGRHGQTDWASWYHHVGARLRPDGVVSCLPFGSTFPSQFPLTAVKVALLSQLNVSHLNFLDAFLPLSKGWKSLLPFLSPLPGSRCFWMYKKEPAGIGLAFYLME